jgi:hypothetical protein
MNIKLPACIALLATMCATSLAQSYSVQSSIAPYSNLEHPVSITTSFSNSIYLANLPISIAPFGRSFDLSAGLTVSTHGYVAVADAANNVGAAIVPMSASMGRLDTSSAISYAISGDPGSRVVTIEWKNVRLVGNPKGDFMNLQLSLFENSSDFEVHVGPHRVSDVAAYGGYEGPPIGTAIGTADFSSYSRTFFLSGYDANLTFDTTFVFFPTSGTPVSGRVYHFHYGPAAGVAASRSEREALRLAPNPCSGMARIAVPARLAGERIDLVLYDQLGREALRADDIGSGGWIDVSALTAGMYHPVAACGGVRYQLEPIIVR